MLEGRHPAGVRIEPLQLADDVVVGSLRPDELAGCGVSLEEICGGERLPVLEAGLAQRTVDAPAPAEDPPVPVPEGTGLRSEARPQATRVDQGAGTS